MRMSLSLPPLERLNSLFFYDEEDGELYSRITRGRRLAGMLAGGVNRSGYLTVSVDAKRHLVHRVIWKMKTGNDPALNIDHKDGDRQNNRFANLREANQSQNGANARLGKGNRSGVKGVFWWAKAGKWQAKIMLNRRSHDLGRFDRIEDAAEAVRRGRERLHLEFARSA